jgi:hypothetical protein
MDREQTTARLADLAHRFWTGVDAPDANEMDVLFTALAERDIARIEAILQEHGIDIA